MPIAQAIFTSNDQTWNSPQNVVDRIRKFSPIALDPCSNPTSIVNADTEWRIERGEDGLTRPWPTKGLVYVNPPYDELERWAAKMAKESARGVEIIACIPARTDTKAWQDSIFPSCDAVCFWRGRMKFGAGRSSSSQTSMLIQPDSDLATGDNTAPFPSALPYWGRRKRKFQQHFFGAGWVMTREIYA